MAKNLPLRILIGGTVAVLLFTAAAQFILFGGGELTMVPLDKLPDVEIPGAIILQLDRNKMRPGYDAYFDGESLYLAARMGECPTGGYGVYLGDPRLEEGEAFITVEFERPKPWDMVTQALTYPRTVVKVALTRDCPAAVVFLAVDGSQLARAEVVHLTGE